jgi:hypothetical protein
MAVPGILMNMDLTTEDRRPSQETARLTPRERLERFVALQRRARQLLAASPKATGSTGCATCASAAFMLSSDDPLNVFQLLARAGVQFVIYVPGS